MNFEKLIEAAIKLNASDIHIVAGLPPALRVSGDIIMAKSEPLTRDEIREMVYALINEKQKEVLEEKFQLCFSINKNDNERVRVTVYMRAGSPELAIRLCNKNMKSRNELSLPEIIDKYINKHSGLILITGPTGVGKTTTMNYLIDRINSECRCKIVTIEDPVEYIHPHKKAIVIQQELYADVTSFSSALVHVLRQDPDVICVGEMRDYETISTALTAAETGHLVVATLHTPDVCQTIERIISVFPPAQQPQVIVQLANCVQLIIAQQLIPTVNRKSRVLATEVLG